MARVHSLTQLLFHVCSSSYATEHRRELCSLQHLATVDCSIGCAGWQWIGLPQTVAMMLGLHQTVRRHHQCDGPSRLLTLTLLSTDGTSRRQTGIFFWTKVSISMVSSCLNGLTVSGQSEGILYCPSNNSTDFIHQRDIGLFHQVKCQSGQKV